MKKLLPIEYWVYFRCDK